MARIAGVDLPLNKRVEIGLTYIFGIGRPTWQPPPLAFRGANGVGEGAPRGNRPYPP